MDKYSLDYNHLEKALSRPKTFRYEDVKHRLEKVAFGTVRFMDASEDIDGLWEIKATDEGDVIIAKYEYGDDEVKTSISSWDVLPDKRGSTIHIFYKGEPVTKIASAKLGANNQDLPFICKNASIRLNGDSAFRDMLLEEVADVDKARLFSRYPELTE